jgi:hypothetical protein
LTASENLDPQQQANFAQHWIGSDPMLTVAAKWGLRILHNRLSIFDKQDQHRRKLMKL